MQLDALRAAHVPLGGGASMYVEPTRALVAVDVNTGGDTTPAAGLKANIAAARELPRQLRLRGLGGQITLDLAPMPKKDRRQFETRCAPPSAPTRSKRRWSAGPRWAITNCSASATARRWRYCNELPDLRQTDRCTYRPFCSDAALTSIWPAG